MDATTYTIGQLAHLSGLSVKTVRFYSDQGLVPAAGRTRAGYRIFNQEARQRLAFIRTLRELGVDLATIRAILDKEVSVAAVAAAHMRAIDVQLRVLATRRAVLRLVAQRAQEAQEEVSEQEVRTLDKLVQASNEERRRLLADFLDGVFGGLEVDPAFEQRMRSATPDLPEGPSPQQIDAWVELAELLADEDFRRRVRAMAEQAASDRASQGAPSEAAMAAQGLLMDRAGAAVAAGIEPGSAAARPILDEIAGAFAAAHGKVDGPGYRSWLLGTLDTFTDRRAERYWQLLAVINAWPPIPSSMPAWEWTQAALRG